MLSFKINLPAQPDPHEQSGLEREQDAVPGLQAAAQRHDPPHPIALRGDLVIVTQSDIDDVLRRAGLPLEEAPTRQPKAFSDAALGLEIYFPIIDREAYLRAPGAPDASLLTHPLY
jgi:hypothetical protein